MPEPHPNGAVRLCLRKIGSLSACSVFVPVPVGDAHYPALPQ